MSYNFGPLTVHCSVGIQIIWHKLQLKAQLQMPFETLATSALYTLTHKPIEKERFFVKFTLESEISVVLFLGKLPMINFH